MATMFKDKLQNEHVENDENTESEYEVVFKPNDEQSVECDDTYQEGTKKADVTEREPDKNEKQCHDPLEMLQRLAAEFDNYKKRTVKEKEYIYTDATKDVVLAMLPVLDSLERAAQLDSGEAERFKEGINMVLKQFKEVLKGLDVEEISATGEKFDPEVHCAMMHIKDTAFESNIVVEELQKGYKIKDRVIRYSLVKVAN